jgi:protein involved in polysaccharide export with SLBB domain
MIENTETRKAFRWAAPHWMRAGLVILFLSVAAGVVWAQTTDDSAEPPAVVQSPTTSPDQTQIPCSSPDSDDLPDQSPDSPLPQKQNPCPNSSRTLGETGAKHAEDWWTAPRPVQAAPETPQQLIEILQREPQALALVRDAAAPGLGLDSADISNDDIYDLIRQSRDFRTQVEAQLRSLGYLPAVDDSRQPPAPFGAPNPAAPWSSAAERPAPPHRPEKLDEIPVRQQTVPYRSLPSLRDLYTQVRQEDLRLRRFGSDVFALGTGNAGELPMDLPAGPDYVLGPGDGLTLNLWGGRSERLSRTIDRQGEVSLPEAGTLPIAGLTIAQAQDAIAQALATQFQDEHVELSLDRVRSVRIYVVGDVQRPGGYDVSSLSTPLNALVAAGGPAASGSLRILRQYRGEKLVREIDLYDFLLHGVRSGSDRLLPGDTLLVPPAGPQVAVAGMVRRPAIYELRGGESLSDVLEMAGGVRVSGSVNQIRVERIVAHERRVMLSLSGDSKALAHVPGFVLQDGDQVLVSPILPYHDEVVYLEGHVYRPGRYPWHEGMTAADLLHAWQDLLPEPADRAEIVRLAGPDLRPQVIPFDLPDQLIGNGPIQLEPFDVVRVFGRYEADPPMVSIFGEVLRPGKYPMSRGMTAADLLRMAGGFRRGAYREQADLSTYVVRDGQRVLLSHTVVAMEKALQGDRSADVALKPGDVLGIRQLTGWQDIGASVTLSGEVRYAGTYGIQEGERLSSVIERAGGFLADAYPAGAVLERAQVRDLEQQSRQQMIQRIQASAPTVRPGISTPQDQVSLLQAMQQQQQQVVAALRSHPASGRLVIRISPNLSAWKNTPADIELRAGDTLVIPKRPDFVIVTGQVFNATAISWAPGRDAGWYLRQAGGATRSGDRKEIFIVRADGSVVGAGAGWGSLWSRGSALDVRMEPGDAIVVPERVIGGSMLWRNLLGTAQIMSSVAITGAAAGVF